MRVLPSTLSLFRNDFNKFNNTEARLLDYIFEISFLAKKNVIVCHYFSNVVKDVITFPKNL